MKIQDLREFAAEIPGNTYVFLRTGGKFHALEIDRCISGLVCLRLKGEPPAGPVIAEVRGERMIQKTLDSLSPEEMIDIRENSAKIGERIVRDMAMYPLNRWLKGGDDGV